MSVLPHEDVVAVMAVDRERSIVFANDATSQIFGLEVVPGDHRCRDVGNLLHPECLGGHSHCPLTRGGSCVLRNTLACGGNGCPEGFRLYEVTCALMPRERSAAARVLKTVRPLVNPNEQAMLLAVRNRELTDKLSRVSDARDYALKELSLARQSAGDQEQAMQETLLLLRPHFSAVGGLLDSLLRRGAAKTRRRILLQALEDQVRHIHTLITDALESRQTR